MTNPENNFTPEELAHLNYLKQLVDDKKIGGPGDIPDEEFTTSRKEIQDLSWANIPLEVREEFNRRFREGQKSGEMPRGKPFETFRTKENTSFDLVSHLYSLLEPWYSFLGIEIVDDVAEPGGKIYARNLHIKEERLQDTSETLRALKEDSRFRLLIHAQSVAEAGFSYGEKDCLDQIVKASEDGLIDKIDAQMIKAFFWRLRIIKVEKEKYQLAGGLVSQEDYEKWKKNEVETFGRVFEEKDLNTILKKIIEGHISMLKQPDE